MINRLSLLLSAGLLLISPALMAGQLTVSPLTLNMTPTQPNAIYKLTNGADQESFYQLQLFAWEQVDGKTRLLRQNDLLVTPPVTLIPGNGEQTVRVIRQQPTTAQNEKSYRLIISELPDTENPQGANLKVLLRMSLPVFVGGDGLEPQLSAYFRDGTLRIRNSGGKHAKVSDAAWLNRDSNKKYSIQTGLVGYALPDRELHIPVSRTPPENAIKYFTAIVNGESQTLMVNGKDSQQAPTTTREQEE